MGGCRPPDPPVRGRKRTILTMAMAMAIVKILRFLPSNPPAVRGGLLTPLIPPPRIGGLRSPILRGVWFGEAPPIARRGVPGGGNPRCCLIYSVNQTSEIFSKRYN